MYSEEELLKQLKLGDEKAFELLVKRYQELVITLCHRFLSSQDAEDQAQEVFIKLLNKVSSFKGNSLLKTWIYRITVNHCLTFLRDQKITSWVRGAEKMIENLITTKSSDGDIEHQEIQLQKENEVKKAIRTLPENQRIALTLRVYEQLSYDEIAEIMDVTTGSVESLLFRAKRNLKKRLLKLFG